MTIRHYCRAPMCFWFHSPVASPFLPTGTADVPPWCTPTWASIPQSYGALLTDVQVIDAHMATHSVAERTGRMPSRAEVEAVRELLTEASHYSLEHAS